MFPASNQDVTHERAKALKAELRSRVIAGLWEWAKILAQAGVLAALLITFVAQSHVVQGASMEETLHDRERLMVEKVSYRVSEPKRGHIIVFRSPIARAERMVKRVIGVPGDVIEIKERTVYVNGVALDEPYTKGPTYYDMAPMEVKPGHVFVLGDNRNNSLDSRSRYVGQIPYDQIVGRAIFSYWPLTSLRLFPVPSTFANL